MLALAVAGCHNQYDEKIEPFNPRAIQSAERDSAVGAPETPTHPLPTTFRSEFPLDPNATRPSENQIQPTTGKALGTDEKIVRMSLRELIQRAVANSSDVKVAGYQPAIDETRVIEAEANFDPTFFVNTQYSESNLLNPTQQDPTFNPAGINGNILFNTASAQVGVRQNLESGGKIEMRFDPAWNERRPGTIQGSTLDPNPFWTNDLTVEITQPLLRDFGADVNRARIVINKNNQRISLLDFRDALEKNMADLEKAYWQEVEAMRDVQIAEELLNRTLSTSDILWQRRTQDVGRQQLSQAVSSLETRRTLLIRARAHVRDLSDQIKRLMNDPEFPVAGPTVILPADKPVQEQIKFSEQDQINTALENRFELGQQQLRVDSAGLAADVAKNNLLPQLNLVTAFGPRGFGDHFETSIDDTFGWDHLDYSIGFQLEIPIGNRAARAIWRRAQLQRMQAIDQYRGLVDQVTLDVRSAMREVNTTWQEMVGTRNARFAAADSLAAIEERERANEPLTPEFINRKLDAQAQLADAERAEATATYGYMIALSDLEHKKGTLLRYNNVIMQETPLQQVTAR
jgi:outer membrane protein TolC